MSILVVKNARIYTLMGEGEDNPTANAICIVGGRVVAFDQEAEVRKLRKKSKGKRGFLFFLLEICGCRRSGY
jgi:predicted amidohydrolase YtcJ